MRYLILYILFCFSPELTAQNLIQNGSFEELTRCITNCDNVETGYETLAFNWRSPDVGGSPDIFSPCNYPIDSIITSPVCTLLSTPNNFRGAFQFAKTGSNYGGFLCDAVNPNSNRPQGGFLLREFLTTNFELLKLKNRYCLSINFNNPVGYWVKDSTSLEKLFLYSAIKKIGILLTINNPNLNNPNFEDIYPEPTFVLNHPSEEFIVDTSNWVELEHSFIADSSYSYLTIGNFEDRITPNYQIFTNYLNCKDDPNLYPIGCYYYLDDISLYEINDISISTTQTQIYPKQSVWLNTNNKPDAIEWFANDTLTPIGTTDSILVQPQQTTTYYVKSLQCRYTSWDTITIEVLPEPLIPVNVKVLNNLSSDYFNIQYTGDFKPSLAAELYNSVGQLIGKFTFTENTQVPISQLAAGVYYCRINGRGIPVMSERIVKVN